MVTGIQIRAFISARLGINQFFALSGCFVLSVSDQNQTVWNASRGCPRLQQIDARIVRGRQRQATQMCNRLQCLTGVTRRFLRFPKLQAVLHAVRKQLEQGTVCGRSFFMVGKTLIVIALDLHSIDIWQVGRKIQGLPGFFLPFLLVAELAPGSCQHGVSERKFRIGFGGLLQKIFRRQCIKLAQFGDSKGVNPCCFMIEGQRREHPRLFGVADSWNPQPVPQFRANVRGDSKQVITVAGAGDLAKDFARSGVLQSDVEAQLFAVCSTNCCV